MLARVFKLTHSYNISLFFIGLMFFLPFVIVHHEQPIGSFYPEWVAGALGLVALFSVSGSVFFRTTQTQLSQLSLKIPQISLVFIGLAAILCVQWALGMLHSNQYALLMLSYFIWAFLLVVLGSRLRDELGLEKTINTLVWSLVVAGIINIAIVVLQFVMRTGGNIPFLPDLSGFGAISQANHFADFCALATASLIYLYAKGHFSFSFFNLLLICFIVMLSLSGSRSGWLYLTIFTILLTLMHKNMVKKGNDNARTRGAWHAGLMLLPAFIFIQLFIYYFVPNELVSLPTERLINGATSSTSSLRSQFWYDSLRLFLQNPWLGVGAENLRIATYFLIDTPTATASKQVFEHTHNLFLHLLAEMGIGAFLIVAFGLWNWIKPFSWSKLNLETYWIAGLLAVIGLHSMLEYPLWYTFFLGITSVLLGIGDEKLITINFSKLSANIVKLSFALALTLGVSNLTTMIIANVKLENWWNKLTYENINEQAYLNWVGENSLLTPYADSMRAVTIGNDDYLDIDKTILLHQSVMSFMPIDAVAFQLALLLEFKGEHDKAVKQLNRALIAFPNSFKPFLENPTLKYRQEYLNLYAETQVGIANQSK